VLIEHGATGFSTVAVAEAADLSNGAVFNHFNTRLDLLAATVEHALAELRESFARAFSAVGPQATVTDLLQILWECMTLPEQTAVTDVFAQARTDGELQALLTPVMAEHHRYINVMVSLIEVDGRRPDPHVARTFSFLFIYAMVGLTVNNVVGAGVGQQEDFIELGRRMFEVLADSPTDSTGSE
jgi:AcrR family transcriptional regulator